MPTKKRDYKKEYASYHAKPKQKKRRAARNQSRRILEKEGIVRKGDGRDVHHRDRNPENKARNNIAAVSKKKNRSWRKGKKGALS